MNYLLIVGSLIGIYVYLIVTVVVEAIVNTLVELGHINAPPAKTLIIALWPISLPIMILVWYQKFVVRK